jgi:hypothetical protein
LDKANAALDFAIADADWAADHEAKSDRYIDAAWVLSQLNRRAEAEQIIGKALSTSQQILNQTKKSEAFAKVAKVLSLMRHYRAARLVCDRCDPVHRLKAYTYILNQYAKATRGATLVPEEERLTD